jgi:hypothetical protein
MFTANASSSRILVILMMEAPRSSETSVVTKVTRHNIQENDIHHSQELFQLILSREARKIANCLLESDLPKVSGANKTFFAL